MIEEAFVTILRNDAGVGELAEDRIYLMEGQAGENETFCVVSSVGGGDTVMHDEASGVCNRTIQVNCMSKDIGTTKKLAKAVKAALRDFRGSVASVNVFYADHMNEVDLASPDYGHQVALDFDTSFSEA